MIKRQRNHKGEGSRLKDELMQAAMRILDRAPATSLSLRMVAREAGVAAPSVYPHFPDAATMMSEIVRECWEQMAAAMADAARSCTSDDAFDCLKEQMAAFVRYAMERPSRYQLLFALQPVEEEDTMAGYLRPAYREARVSIDRYVTQGGRLPAEDEMSTVLLVISLAHGRIALAHLAPHREGNSAVAVERFVLSLLDRIFHPSL